MRLLSKPAENTLISAIEKAAALVNTGLHPNDAIVKSASESGIPAGHINLMVHAYNTGRTTKQREQGENTLEKAAEFQLADADAVLKALYPETVKTSAEVQRAQVVSGEYALSPAGMLSRRRNEMQKAAAAAVALPENTYVRPPRDEHAAAMRAHSEKVAAQRAEEETRRQATAAYTKAAAAMDELTVYFRTPGNMSFQDAVREVGLRHGDAGVSVLKKVAAVYPHIEKQAATNKRLFGSDRVYDLVENVLDSVSTYTEAQGRVAVKKAADGAREEIAPAIITGSVLAEEGPLELKQAGAKTAMARTGLFRLTDPPNPDSGYPGAPPGGNVGWRLDDAAPEGHHWYEIGQAGTRRLLNEEHSEYVPPEIYEGVSAPAGSGSSAGGVEPWIIDAVRRSAGGGGPGGGGPGGGGPGGGGGNGNNRGHGRNGGDRNRDDNDDRGRRNGPGLNMLTAPTQIVGRIMGMGAEPKADRNSGAEKIKAQYNAVSNPAHDAAIKNIRAKSVLHDLIINDPVISGHDPQDVAMAFNDIAELAPNLVDTPGMLQTVLRKRLESGQLADFDVKQILEMDKLRAERDKVQGEARKLNLETM
jgi:hypothetical protein